MIAKITRGSGFRGTLAYTLAPDHQPEIVGGNMAGENVRDLAREFGAVRQLRPDVEKPVVHTSLSFDPGRQGRSGDRQLTHAELGRISADYLKRMGYDLDRLQWVAIQHRDKDHQHVHLVVSRVRLDGSLVHQPWEYLRNQRVCREIERDPQYKLRTVVQTREPGIRAPTRGEDRMFRDRGLLSEKERLKGLIQEAAWDRPTMTEFLERLQRRGVEVRPNLARTGHVSGISYRLDRVAAKGSQLGRAYTWEGLQRMQGVRYDPIRDRPAIERAFQATLPRKGVASAILERQLGRVAARTIAAAIPAASPALRIAATARGLTGVGRDAAWGDRLRAALGMTTAINPQVADLTRFLGKGLPRPKVEEPEYDPPIEMEIPFGRPPDEPDRDW